MNTKGSQNLINANFLLGQGKKQVSIEASHEAVNNLKFVKGGILSTTAHNLKLQQP